MSTPFLGEIRIVSFNYPPKGWAFCNGQTLAIAQNQALFALLGTTYGGNGTTTFQLPNLQAWMPVHQGASFSIGSAGGEYQHALLAGEMPSHTHQAKGASTAASSASATDNTWATTVGNAYATASNTKMLPAALATAGGGQPHNNMPPNLVLSFVIALVGIFPSQN